ncbi:MAG TPA: tRNA pseudouridine(55) synthase TruB [Dermatophilaceae bacterium]|nr:tRNA pseudouridine(55) synthase TruB [Dermatophilaceae bacterium]
MSVPDGLLVVDKPQGWTSHDVVARSRRICGTRKVGHAGTLDPMATGVLVIGIGRATRLLTFLVGSDKDYSATIRLGQSTVTDDAEGEVTDAAGAAGVTESDVRRAVATLTGEIQQVPSAVSAVKVGGERSYARVRAGQGVSLQARPVTVSRFEVRELRPVSGAGPAQGGHRSTGAEPPLVSAAWSTGAEPPCVSSARGSAGAEPPCVDVDVEVTVSSGTYVRALARDLGAALGTGGHLTRLRRSRVGSFTLDRAHGLEELTARAGAGDPLPVIPLAEAARAAFPVRELSAEEARALGYGQRIRCAEPGRREPVAAFAPDGTLVAMLDESAHIARSHVVFAPAAS